MESDALAYPSSCHHGLTKRELFAAMAMQGILAGGAYLDRQRECARYAAAFADALLDELKGESRG